MKRTLLVAITIAMIHVPAVASAAKQSFSVLSNNTKPGMLLSLTLNSGVVEPSSDKNATRLIGVYAPVSDGSLNEQADQVQVATDGSAQTLVSTLNGPILVGDKIGTSTVAGVGAKALGSGYVVGAAQASLDSSTKGAISTEVNDANGRMRKVWIASIPVVVKVQHTTSASSSAVPQSLQSVADSIAGKHVGLIALLFSFVLLLTGLAVAGLIIATAVRSGFVAISRQPLAKRVINLQIFRAVGIGLAILAVGVGSAYLILKFL